MNLNGIRTNIWLQSQFVHFNIGHKNDQIWSQPKKNRILNYEKKKGKDSWINSRWNIAAPPQG